MVKRTVHAESVLDRASLHTTVGTLLLEQFLHGSETAVIVKWWMLKIILHSEDIGLKNFLKNFIIIPETEL